MSIKNEHETAPSRTKKTIVTQNWKYDKQSPLAYTFTILWQRLHSNVALNVKKNQNEKGTLKEHKVLSRFSFFFHDDLYVQRIDNDSGTNVLYEKEQKIRQHQNQRNTELSKLGFVFFVHCHWIHSYQVSFIQEVVQVDEMDER